MKEVTDYLRLRATIYNILSAPFYREPSQKDIELVKKYMPVFEELAADIGSVFRDGLNLVKDYIEAGANTRELAVMFARLFLGVNKATAEGHTITPHESVYLSPERLIMQEPWEKVYKIYYDAGIGKDKDFKEPEDHITAEMSFMAYLSRQTADLADDGNIAEARKMINIQKEFLTDHLKQWIPLFATDLKVSSAHVYYLGMGLMCQGFVDNDYNFIEELEEMFCEV